MTATAETARETPEYKAICRAIDRDYRIFNIDPTVRGRKDRALKDLNDRAAKTEAIADKVFKLMKVRVRP